MTNNLFPALLGLLILVSWMAGSILSAAKVGRPLSEQRLTRQPIATAKIFGALAAAGVTLGAFAKLM